jgi:dihydroorotase
LHFCHVSAVGVLKAINALRGPGTDVVAELTPHHLLLDTGQEYPRATWAKVLQPLRDPQTREDLWEYVRNGGAFDTIGTDHAPHSLEEKALTFEEAPAGFSALDVAGPLLLTQVFNYWLTLETLMRAYITTPATTWHLAGKGAVAPGYDADLVIWHKSDPYPVDMTAWTTQSRLGPYGSFRLTARADTVLVGGKIVKRHGEVWDETPGHLLRRRVE